MIGRAVIGKYTRSKVVAWYHAAATFGPLIRGMLYVKFAEH